MQQKQIQFARQIPHPLSFFVDDALSVTQVCLYRCNERFLSTPTIEEIVDMLKQFINADADDDGNNNNDDDEEDGDEGDDDNDLEC